MFCTYLELDMDIDVVICCVELVVIVFKFSTCELLDMDIDVVICCVELVATVFKFCTCELLDMDNGVDYDVKLVAIVLNFHVNT